MKDEPFFGAFIVFSLLLMYVLMAVLDYAPSGRPVFRTPPLSTIHHVHSHSQHHHPSQISASSSTS